MLRRITAALLVFGWISLSGFDVVEDLHEAPGRISVASSSAGGNTLANRGGWGPLANNMVESAYRTQHVITIVAHRTRTLINFDPVTVFRKHSSLHKLYRVFLI